MSTSITTSFVTDYMSDMHVAFQQGATKLRGLTRLKTGVIGSTATFQVIGKGYAGTKSRHGDIPLMNATHTTASATLTDYYAGEYIDKLDELKIKHDERRAAAINGAGALGRKIDNLITDDNTQAAYPEGIYVNADGQVKVLNDPFFDFFTKGVPDAFLEADFDSVGHSFSFIAPVFLALQAVSGPAPANGVGPFRASISLPS